MRLNRNKYFALFPCCKIVDGKNKSAIYDLQRETYVLIPLSLSYILRHDKSQVQHRTAIPSAGVA